MYPSLLHDREVINPVETLFNNIPNRAEWNLQALKKLAELSHINFYQVRNSKKQTVLHLAAGWGRQSLVIDQILHGAEVDAKDIEGQTPLHYACNHAHKTVATKLIEAGADVNLADNEGWTAMHFALARKDNPQTISSSYWDIVKLLVLNHANPYIKSKDKKQLGINCFSLLRDRNQRRQLCLDYTQVKLKGVTDANEREKIINKYFRVKDFFEIINTSDTDEDCELLQSLLTRRFVESRLETRENITPLHRAAGHGFIKIARILIEAGADVNAKDDQGRIPLHNAAQFGHIDMIGLLAEMGSMVNCPDNQGNTPIHYAAASSRTSVPCEQLCRAGADITVRNNAGELPYDMATLREVKEILKIWDPDIQIEEIHEDSLSFQLSQLVDNETGLLTRASIIDRVNSELASCSKITKVLLNNEGWLYQIVRRKMLDTIAFHVGDNYSTYEIKTIEFILNDKLLNRYACLCQILYYEDIPLNEKLLFHGSRSIDKILSQGFNERYADQNGMFGAGLYFASHSSKSNQYTFGLNQGCPSHDDKSCYICEREMILAQVALGNCLVTQDELPDYRHAPPGFNSVAGRPGPSLKYPEYAIYDGKFAYPSFVIKYYIKP